jgi:hypothetical protein
MNVYIFVLLLFVQLSLFSQNGPTAVYATGNETSVHTASPAARHYMKTSTDLAAEHQLLEQDLDRQLSTYNQAPAERKTELREQIRLTLTAMMDVSLRMTEAEVNRLSEEWKALRAEGVHGEKHAHMLELESRIAAVNTRIKNRRSMATEIVNRRLNELLK